MNSDTELLSKVVESLDEEALNAIFDKYADSIYQYSIRSCRDSTVAERIVGDVFGQLLEQLTTNNIVSL